MFSSGKAFPGAYDDIWRDGVYPKDSELKSFLSSGPAILAALQIQNAFELKHTQDECSRMIESYAYWGGDGGLTEQVMREACGMPPRDLRQHMSRAATAINVENEDEEPEKTCEDTWMKISAALVEHLSTLRRLDNTTPVLKRGALKLKDLPNMNRQSLIESMQANKVLLPSHSRGKTDEVFVPGLFTKVQLSSLIQHEKREDMPPLPEEHLVEAFARYADGSSCRAANAQLLAQVYANIAKLKAKVRGRETDAAKARKDEYHEKANKLTMHENMCASLASRLIHEPVEVPSQCSAPSPPRKRHRTKSSASPSTVKQESDLPAIKQEHPGSAPQAPPDISVRSRFGYSYPETTRLRTRKW